MELGGGEKCGGERGKRTLVRSPDVGMVVDETKIVWGCNGDDVKETGEGESRHSFGRGHVGRRG